MLASLLQNNQNVAAQPELFGEGGGSLTYRYEPSVELIVSATTLRIEESITSVTVEMQP